ncbi:MAG: hypothetical protein CMJ75_05780 [Planctomycetaceae bacterium]|nr:hypothetical protein [Planctomycetaceae bacterium]
MSLAITCTSCQRLLYVEPSHAHQLVRCPVCRSETRAIPQRALPLPKTEDGGPVQPADRERDAADTKTAGFQESAGRRSSGVWFMAVPEGRTYGPVERDELDQWVAAGRVTAECQLRCEGNVWRPADHYYPALKVPVASGTSRSVEGPAVGTANRSSLSNDTGVPLKAHRGLVVLWIGILGSLFFFFPLFSAMAWVMGSSDLREMRQGRMDPRGVGLTRTGQLLGIIQVLGFIVLTVVILFGWLVFRVT